MKIKIMLSVVALMCAGVISAQSIEELISMAKDYNPGLKALQLDYQAELLKADQVNDWPDPKVSLGLGVLPVETRLGAQRFKLGVSQMIPWKGSLDAKSNVVRSMAEVKSNLDEVKEIDIECAIRYNYVKLRFLEGKQIIINERLEVLDALEEIAKSAVRSGKGKLSNVLFTERKREMLMADLELLILKMEQPTIMINRWAGRDLRTEIQIEDELKALKSNESILKYAESGHPQYQVLNNRILASKAKMEMTTYDSKPKIGVGIDYAYIDARNDVTIDGNGRDVLMPMASISIPIHTGRFDATRQEETIRQEAIDTQKRELSDMFVAEIEMAFSRIEYADQVSIKYISLKEITKETLKLMRTEYASEGTRFEELLRLEMELIDYDHEILKAKYDKEMAYSTLSKYK